MATPFTPFVSPDEVVKLKELLKAARPFQETYENRTPGFGVSAAWMNEAVKYWINEFDWSKAMAKISSVDHYTINVKGRKVHFVGHISKDPKAIPLLIVHGWPCTSTDFVEAIKILGASTKPSFTVIVPTVPGFGFGDRPALDKDHSLWDAAELFNALMIQLGYGSGYAVQGGDFGSVIARRMAIMYPACKAIHVNYLPLLPPASILSLAVSAPTATYIPSVVHQLVNFVTKPFASPKTFRMTTQEITNAQRADTFLKDGRGYAAIHATRPATIGFAIEASPIALLAWMGEKLEAWTDKTPPLDVILEKVTLWWVLNIFPSAIWNYRHMPLGVLGFHSDPAMYVDKPTGYSAFQYEIACSPKMWAARTCALQFFAYHSSGGHFPAMEQPAVFAEDLRRCFAQIYPRA